IQHLDNTKWETIATEHDWSTKIKWLPEENDPSTLLLHTTWEIPANTPTGQYKITYTDGPHTATTKTINYKSNK
ncbi:MAG: neutral/alkaline non-lysosomal ceramidase C-terminal domain-containing protein, partial [Candidatus Hydrogenedentota bacterium]